MRRRPEADWHAVHTTPRPVRVVVNLVRSPGEVVDTVTVDHTSAVNAAVGMAEDAGMSLVENLTEWEVFRGKLTAGLPPDPENGDRWEVYDHGDGRYIEAEVVA